MSCSTIAKVEYSNCEEAHYEVNSSNPNHLDTIISDINSAITDISGIPGADALSGTLSSIPGKLDKEKIRYTTYASAFKTFADSVPAVDLHLKTKINDLFAENYANKSAAEIKAFVKTYAESGVQIELIYLMQELGLNIEDVTDLVYINGLISSMDGMSKEDALELIQQELANSEGFHRQLLKALQGSLVGNPVTIIDNANSIFESSVETAIEKLTETAYKKVFSQAEIQSALQSINRLTGKLAAVDATLAANPYIKPGGHTFAKRDAIIKSLTEQKSIYNNLNTAQKARIDTLAKRVGTGITVALVALQLTVEGYQSRVIDGKDWEDTLEDIGVAGIGIGTSIIAGTIAANIISSTTIGSAAGPIGFGVGLVTAVVYEFGVKDWIKEKANEITDWWHELWW